MNNNLKDNIMNSKVIEILAKTRVRFDAKIGKTTTLQEAILFETEKLTRLAAQNDYPY